MIFIAFNILLFLLLFIGIGLLFPWITYRHERHFEALLLCFWTGWSLAIAFLQVWHYFFAVGLGAFILLFAAGAAGWWRSRAQVAETMRCWSRRQALLLAGLALIPCGMLANHVLFNSPNSDYALYHLPTLRWYTAYAIVPGLGNVFGPLAWNCSSFLYTAALNAGWLADRAYYVSNTLPAYAAVLQSAAGLYGLFARGALAGGSGRLRMSDLFYALMTPVILMQASTAYLVAYSPDPLIFFIQIIIAGQMVALFEDAWRDLPRFQSRSAELVLLVTAGISVKLSLAVFGALCLLVVALVGILRYQAWPWRMPRLWLSWIGLGLALITPWVGRNVVLTGYLLYPNTAIAFPVEWKIPPLLADAATPVVIAWARTVNGSIEDTGDLAWFLSWWQAFPFFARQAFFITLGLLALEALTWFFLRARLRRITLPGRLTSPGKTGRAADPGAPAADPVKEPGFLAWEPAVILVLIIAPSLVFWFVMGPSYRFSGAMLWILLVAALMIAHRLLVSWLGTARAKTADGKPPPEKGQFAAEPLAVAACLVLGFSLYLSPNHFSNNLSRRWMLIPPTESALAEQAMPRANIRQRVTDSGLVIHLPAEGVEECWDAPLPCTTEANFLPGLRERVPGDPQSGYILLLDD